VAVTRAALGGAPRAEQGCAVGCEACGRLRRALLDALIEHDVQSVAAADLAARAGLPATALAAHYGTVDNCVVATFDEVSEELYRRHVEAFAGPGDWHARFSSAVVAALAHIAATPGAARLCVAEPARDHPRVRTRRDAARRRVVRLLADEYERERAGGPSDIHFEFLVGALYRAAQGDLAAGREPSQVAERLKELLALLEPAPA
jgi:AcrR family transcriptional regulator